MLIDGKFLEKTEKIEVVNPYNGEKVGEVSACDKDDVEKAIASAKNARETAKNLTPYQRYEILVETAQEIRKRREELANLITSESGKVLKESLIEVDRAYQTLLFSAEESKRISGEAIPIRVAPGLKKDLGLTIYEPLGVIAAICPFNYPLNLVLHKIGPAIAAGNTIVLKPATSTPLTALELGKILMDNGLPAGVLNIITGKGSEIGNALVESEDVRMISFTGSVEVGKAIASRADMKKLSLELGGNDPLIVMDDTDIEKAVETAVPGAFGNTGQRCTSIKRVLLHEKIADDFIEKFVKKTEKLKVGDPAKIETDIGPLINEKAAVEVENRVNEAIKAGAALLVGNKRERATYWPTILDNVTLKTDLVCTETFGPVAPIIRFKTKEEAVEIANSTIYGLQCGVFTDSLDNVKYFAKNIEAGAVIFNEGPGFRAEHLPFGGSKQSGLGREGVKYAIREMSEVKTVVI